MKYMIILASGAADDPIREPDGKTALDAAHTPALDALAVEGKTGLVATQPEDRASSAQMPSWKREGSSGGWARAFPGRTAAAMIPARTTAAARIRNPPR